MKPLMTVCMMLACARGGPFPQTRQLPQQDLCVKQMRSFVTVQPREQASCIGYTGDSSGAPRESYGLTKENDVYQA